MSDRDIFAEIDAHTGGALLINHLIAWAVAEFEEAHATWPDRMPAADGFASGIAALTLHINAIFATECPAPYTDRTDFHATASSIAQQVEDALWAVESETLPERASMLLTFQGGMARQLREML